MIHKVGDTIPEQFRNNGYSLGLEFPYIYGFSGSNWCVWHRHTGEIVYVEESKYPALRQYRCGEECYRRNGLVPGRASPDVIAEIDAQE